MCARTLAALVRAAADFLDRRERPRGPFTVTVTDCDGLCTTVPVRVWPEPPPPAAGPGGWRMFNDEEQAVVDALRGRGAVTTDELAKLLGREAGTAFRCTLRGLKKRCVIEMSHTHGVRLRE